MKFYNREKELETLKKVEELSQEEAQMTVLVGRRRIGKTQLLLKATEGTPTLYFFIIKKAESLLCRDFIEEAEKKQKFPIGNYHSIGKLFQYLIIDKFQEIDKINPSEFGEIQKAWDLNQQKKPDESADKWFCLFADA